jgi:hypothetical protein
MAANHVMLFCQSGVEQTFLSCLYYASTCTQTSWLSVQSLLKHGLISTNSHIFRKLRKFYYSNFIYVVSCVRLYLKSIDVFTWALAQFVQIIERSSSDKEEVSYASRQENSENSRLNIFATFKPQTNGCILIRRTN